MRFFPSTTFFVVFVLLLVVVGVGVLFTFGDRVLRSNGGEGTLVAERTTFGSLTQVLTEQLSAVDSDNDGLFDWEEELWGTDPRNPDSDGDGTHDGDEVDQGRNPALAGPDDVFHGNHLTPGAAAPQEPATLTEQYARQFFADYLNVRSTGQLQGGAGLGFLTDEAGRLFANERANAISRNELVVVNDAPELARIYGNALGEIFLTHSSAGGHELAIIEQAVVGNRPAELERLESIIRNYNSVLGQLRTLSVPTGAVDAHVGLINGVEGSRAALVDMQATFGDPVRGLVGLESYQRHATEIATALRALQRYFLAQDVDFDESESGSYITRLPL